MIPRRGRVSFLAIFLVAATVTAAAAAVVAVKRAPPVEEPKPLPVVAKVIPAAEPLNAEAQVFRTTPEMVAIPPAALRERSAHARRLATVHYNRAYEGAPPRIPHGLSAEEFQTDACRTCHQRGGFSHRFAAYVPLTPHADRGMCLQCHVGVDAVIGVSEQTADPNTRCVICHPATGGPPRADSKVTWATTVWPQLPALTAGQAPPPIPHDLQYRQNCLTCHGGSAAVEEIRTKHPERADCRQCHLLADPEAAPFVRGAGDMASAAPGSAP